MRILKFSAVWCPSCLIMNNVINKILVDYPNIEIINCDYDIETELVNKYNIGEILPVFVFLDENGIEKTRLIGEKTKKELIMVIESMVSDEKNI